MGLITVEQQEELLDFEDRMWTKCPTDWGACEEVKFESKCPSNCCLLVRQSADTITIISIQTSSRYHLKTSIFKGKKNT